MASKKKSETLKDKAFKLFAKGFGPSSAEVKALGLKSGTRSSYYSKWIRAGKPGAAASEEAGELISKSSKVVREDELIVPKDTPEEPSDTTTNDHPDDEDDDEDIIPQSTFKASPSPQTPREKLDIVEIRSMEENEVVATQTQESRDDGKGKSKEKEESIRKLPTVVAGQGLTFGITISTKTLALYQLAASMSDKELTLGDFIDTCVQDYYRGRGLDLGLVRIGGDRHHE